MAPRASRIALIAASVPLFTRPHLLHAGHRVDDALREFHLALGGSAERGPLRGGAQRRFDDLGASMAEQQRSPRLHEIDVAVAVDVDEERALTAVEEHRRAAHAPEGPNRRIDPARDHGASASEQVLGSGHAWMAQGRSDASQPAASFAW